MAKGSHKANDIDYAIYLQQVAQDLREAGMESTAEDMDKAANIILNYANDER